MVLPGQFLERSTLIPLREDVVLEGLSHRGKKRPGLLILPPTPSDGGGMDHIVAAEVAWAAATNGFPTLRFNYEGVGASQGKPPTQTAELLENANAALTVLIENTGSPAPVMLAIGSSAEIAVELLKRHSALPGLISVNPAGIAPETFTGLPGIALLAIVAEEDLRLPRAALAAALGEAGGTLELVPGTGPTYTRNLPEVGKSVVRFLQSLSR